MKKLPYGNAIGHMALASTLTAIHTALMNQNYTPAKIVASGDTVTVTPGVYTSGGNFVSDGKAASVDVPNDGKFDIAPNPDSVQERTYLVGLTPKGDAFIVAGDVATGTNKAELPDLPKFGLVMGIVRVAVAPGDKGLVGGKKAFDGTYQTVTCSPVSVLVETFPDTVVI